MMQRFSVTFLASSKPCPVLIPELESEPALLGFTVDTSNRCAGAVCPYPARNRIKAAPQTAEIHIRVTSLRLIVVFIRYSHGSATHCLSNKCSATVHGLGMDRTHLWNVAVDLSRLRVDDGAQP
jgi:hypothetical protein